MARTRSHGVAETVLPLAVTSSGDVTASAPIRSDSASGGIGYRAGAGEAVTQLTSKSTGVTINTPCGQITTHDATLNAGAEVVFTVTNSTVVAGDVVVAHRGNGGTAGSYTIAVDSVGSGQFNIIISNLSTGNLGEAITINFAVIKSVAS